MVWPSLQKGAAAYSEIDKSPSFCIAIGACSTPRQCRRSKNVPRDLLPPRGLNRKGLIKSRLAISSLDEFLTACRYPRLMTGQQAAYGLYDLHLPYESA